MCIALGMEGGGVMFVRVLRWGLCVEGGYVCVCIALWVGGLPTLCVYCVGGGLGRGE